MGRNSDGLHQQVISWLVSNRDGARENHLSHEFDFDGFYPDVVVVGNGEPTELHEVQMVNVRELPYGLKRVLWIVLPSSWEEARCLKVPFVREDNIVELINLESKLRGNIRDLKVVERHLSEKVAMARKQYLQSFKQTRTGTA